MARPVSKDMSVCLTVGDITVTWNAEDVSWSPDVADDMSNRVLQLFHDALETAMGYGYLVGNEEKVSEDEVGVEVDGG